MDKSTSNDLLNLQVSGHQGAEAISKVLAARTEDLHFLLDEGMTVLKGVLDWVEPAVAL